MLRRPASTCASHVSARTPCAQGAAVRPPPGPLVAVDRSLRQGGTADV